jgi:NTE family protein
MHWAAAYGQREALELLWWLGGDIRAIDARGHAPLHLIGEDDPLRAVCARLAQMPNRFQMERPLYVLYPPVNLVFKGGGARGIAYVGALAELERRGQLRWVDRVSGTSAGAITAMLVGLGYTSNEIEEILCETNETGVSLNDLIRVIRGATNLVPASNRAGVLMENLNQTVKRGGFCAGNKFFEWIDGVIAKKVGEWAPDREDAGHNLTFGEYRQWIEQGKCKHIRFYAMNIVDQTLVCFSSEDERSKDIVIASAIRASMFIPGAFEPYELFVKREGVVEPAQELGIFIDGGVLYNVPIDDLDLFSCRTTHPSGAIPSGNGQTLGFDLVEKSSKQPEAPQERPSLTVVTQRAAAVLSNREEILRKRRRFDEARLVRIDASRVSLIGGFFINHQNKKELIRSGRRAVRDFFAAQEALVRTEEGQRQDPRPLFSPGTLRILQLSEWPAPAARDLPPAAPARADFREVALPNAPREVGREAAEERKEQDLFEISDNDEDAARPADRGPGY